MRKQFIDKDKSGNLRDGVEYFAVGLIVEDCTTKDWHQPGKDYVVEYINPWGEHVRAFKDAEGIIISDISDFHAEVFERAFLETGEEM